MSGGEEEPIPPEVEEILSRIAEERKLVAEGDPDAINRAAIVNRAAWLVNNLSPEALERLVNQDMPPNEPD